MPTYTCSHCGNIHDEWPAYGFLSLVELYQSEYDRHPFARDWFDGITLAEVERRVAGYNAVS